MFFHNFFSGRNNSSNASGKGVKLNRKNRRVRYMTLEPLESRDLLTVTTGSIDNDEYAQIRSQYSDFNLPELQADLNIMTITPDSEEAGLTLDDLRSAIETTGTTTQPDLILVRTTDTANTIQFDSYIDFNILRIDVDSAQFGSVTILGWGTENFTLYSEININNSDTDLLPVVNLGGITFRALTDSVYAASGIVNTGTLNVSNCTVSGIGSNGITNTSGTLTVSNCTITDNAVGIENSSGTLMVSNSTITGNGCGGIYSIEGTLTVSNCTITGNTSDYGAGIEHYDGNLTVTDSTISGNISKYGGGIYISDHGSQRLNHIPGTYTITNCTISENIGISYGDSENIDSSDGDSENIDSSDGNYYVAAGIYSECTTDSNLTVTNCTISGNSGTGIIDNNACCTVTVSNCTIADNDDSGIIGGNLTVTNCMIVGNSSYNGGGICINGCMDGVTPVITNCTIVGNKADAYGGGIHVGTNDNITITNCTITANSGNGIQNYYGQSITITNSIVSQNTGENIVETISDSSRNNMIDYYPRFVNPPVLDSEGMLTNADTMDLHLRSDSKAIDAGDNSAIAGITTDEDSKPRIYGDAVDIGAYEYQGDRNDEPLFYSSVVNTLNDSFDITDDEWSLREAIYYAPEYVTITFAENLKGSIILTQGQLDIKNPVAINGAGRITIDANQQSRVFYIVAETKDKPVVLNGLVIQNGKIEEYLETYDCCGGGIYTNCTTTITDCTIAGNVIKGNGLSGAVWGGGIYNDTGDITITNCTIAGNTAFDTGIYGYNYNSSGGGIYSYCGSLTIINSIVSCNYADINGNISILSKNETSERYIDGMLSDSSHNNMIGYYPGFVSAPVFDSEGQLTNADTMDLHLRSDSKAINAGDNSAIVGIATDGDNKTRIYGGTVDIGAYEYQGDRDDVPFVYSTVVNTSNDSFDLTDDEWSLREAIYYASEYVTITFADERYRYITLTQGELVIDKALAIDGAEHVSLNGNQKSRVIRVENVTKTPVELNGLKIINGKESKGSGIYISGNIVISNSTISGNVGGGIYANYGDNITITDCTISGNTSGANSTSSGITVYGNNITIANCTISENKFSSQYNSSIITAMYIDGRNNTSITNCTITKNACIGLSCSESCSDITITNCTITENTGDGIKFNSQDNIGTITNCTIVGNSGYGINNSHYCTVTNCTIAGNNIGLSVDCTLVNSIVSCNNSGNLSGNSNSHNNLIGSYPYFVNPPVFDSEGKLTNADTMDLHLRSCSQAIDAGDNSAITGCITDVEGNVRIYGDTVDIGAYEYQGDRDDEPIAYSSVVTTLNDSFDLTDDEWSLREAIYFATEYVTITFAEGLEGTITLTQGQLEVNTALVINGAGHITIDANQKSRVFRISGINSEEQPVVLNGLTIQNGKIDLGNGGGIYNETGTLKVTNCTITGNTAVGGGYDDGFGGGIYGADLTITNCTITGNMVDGEHGSCGGGIYALYSTITNCTITGNTAGGVDDVSSRGGGGGIYALYSTITNCTISGNTAETSSGIYGEGGGINGLDSTITNCTISENTADVGGGILGGNLTITDCTITGNEAKYGSGGGIDGNNLTITDCTIAGNTAGESGGGISGVENMSINNCTITGNVAKYGSGGGICGGYGGDEKIITNCLISGNTACESGGGIYLSETSVSITDSTISDNTLTYAYGKSYGAGIYVYAYNGNSISFTNCTISGNTISSSETLDGGGIYLKNTGYFATAKVSVTNCTIIENDAQGICNACGSLTVTNSTISGNSTGIQNGVLYNLGESHNGGNITITNSMISGNSTGIWSTYLTTVLNSLIVGNKENGIYSTAGTLTVTNCTIAKNNCGIKDGYSGDALRLYNTIIASNTTDVDVEGVIKGYNCLSSFTGWNKGSNNITYYSGDSLFRSVENSDYRLASDSLAVDNGNNQYAIDAGMDETWTDRIGFPRFIGNAIDIGAYESIEWTASQSKVYVGSVDFSWKQYKNTANLRLTWLSGTTRTILGTFASVGEYTWDTTAFANDYGQLTIEYLDENGKALYTESYSGLILNDENVVVHRGNIAESEAWSADKIHLVVGRLNVLEGAGLTIAENTVVKFWKNAYLYTNTDSVLNVNDNVIFTRAEDDTVGGDTNLDGALSVPQYGNDYIRGNGTMNISSNVTMKYVTTTTSGTISSDETWFTGQVYHITDDLTIASGVTLTIQPGTVVKFDSGTSLIVAEGGTLVAEGNSAQPIVFTSVKDDEYGGDTNEDDGEYDPQAGDWKNIYVLGTAIFDHAIVRYIGNVSGSSGAIYGNDDCDITFNNSILEFSKYYGLSIDGGTVNAQNSVFREGQTALLNLHTGSCTTRFTNCTFADSSMFLWCGWGDSKFTNCVVANIVNKFVGYGSGNPNSGAFTNCVFYNPKDSGPQSFSYVGSNGNIWANPLFRDVDNGDYHLMAGSPCIDTGIRDGAPETDITGAPRTDDSYMPNNGESYVDIGAYEFVEGANSSIDLEPIDIQAPESATADDTVTIQWTLRNNGSTAAKGTWTDAIYLVNETTGQSVLVKEIVHAGNIVACDTQTFYADVVIPNVSEGEWEFEVHANTNREIFEGKNIANNTFKGTEAIEVQIQVLSTDTNTLARSLYQIIIPAGKAYNLDFKTAGSTSIYLAENYIPTATKYDYSASKYSDNSYTICIPAQESERVFYLALNSKVSGTIEYTKSESSFQVKGVSQSSVNNTGMTVLTIFGADFDAGMTAVLTSSDESIKAKNVIFKSNSEVIVFFDFLGASTGNYDLKVSLNGQEATLQNALMMQDDYPVSDLDLTLIAPDSVRKGRTYQSKVKCTNNGNTDMIVPRIEVNGQYYTVTGSMLPYILKAGESAYVSFEYFGGDAIHYSAQKASCSYENWDAWSTFEKDVEDATKLLANIELWGLQTDYSTILETAYALHSSTDKGLFGGSLTNEKGYIWDYCDITATWTIDGQEYSKTVQTDDSGRYLFVGVPENVTITLQAEGLCNLSTTQDNFVYELGNSVTTEITLDESTSLTANIVGELIGYVNGYVLDSTGTPISNATVIATNEQGKVHTDTTRSNGWYYIDPLGYGDWSIKVFDTQSNFLSQTITISEDNRYPNVEFNFENLNFITGRAMGVNGEFLKNTRVSLLLASDGSEIATEYTDELGNYKFSNVPLGDYIISVNSSDYMFNNTPVSVESDGSTINLDLHSVTNSWSGVVHLPDGSLATSGKIALMSDSQTLMVDINSDGTFVFPSIKFGDYTIWIGTDTGIDFISKSIQSETSEEIFMRTQSSFEYRVILDDGYTIPDNGLWLYLFEYDGGLITYHAIESNGVSNQIDNLPNGKYIVCIGSPNSFYDSKEFELQNSTSVNIHYGTNGLRIDSLASKTVTTQQLKALFAHESVNNSETLSSSLGTTENDGTEILYADEESGWLDQLKNNLSSLYNSFDFPWLVHQRYYRAVYNYLAAKVKKPSSNYPTCNYPGCDTTRINQKIYARKMEAYERALESLDTLANQYNEFIQIWKYFRECSQKLDFSVITEIAGSLIGKMGDWLGIGASDALDAVGKHIVNVDKFVADMTGSFLAAQAGFVDQLVSEGQVSLNNWSNYLTAGGFGATAMEDLAKSGKVKNIGKGLGHLLEALSAADTISGWCNQLIALSLIVSTARGQVSAMDQTIWQLKNDIAIIEADYFSCGHQDKPDSEDPNEIVGPVGSDFVTHDEGTEEEPYLVIDGKNWISNNAGQENAYTIYFENKKTASAAAQEIFVTIALPEGMDWSTLQFDEISIGNEVYELSDDNLICENTWLVDQKSTGEQIKIKIDFNDETGEVEWYLRSYVSSTYDNFPESAYDGFLPPNDDDHNGEGYVSYHVCYDSDLKTDDVVSTSATIVFDTNEAIETNVWLNTIDTDIPVVQMDTAELIDTGISLAWSGSDVGSGIEQYQVYISTDGSTYTLWNTFTADVTSTIYEYPTTGNYSFYILAVDGAGNIGGDPTQTTPSFLIESDMETRIVTKSDAHTSTNTISENITTITDWDAFYMEFWTTDCNSFDSNKTSTAKISYDSTVFQLDTNQTIATPEGITAELSDTKTESNGMTTATVTFTVGEDGYTAPGANMYWGAIHFTPNTAEGAGVQNVLESETLGVTTDGTESSTTVKSMPYDLNHDGKVNSDDFILFATVYGTQTSDVQVGDDNYTEKLLSDYDGDGKVNADDFLAFATNYGIKKGDGRNVSLPTKATQPEELRVASCELRVARFAKRSRARNRNSSR